VAPVAARHAYINAGTSAQTEAIDDEPFDS